MGLDSKDDIMEATYKALSKHGYADLSIQKIADESEKGKSLIYYHYDDKQDLILAFLDSMKNHLEARYSELSDLPAEEALDQLLDMVLGIENEEDWEFRTALLEIRAQLPYNPDLADKFREIDELSMELVSDITRRLGANDPEKKAQILVSLIEGAVNRKIALQDRKGLKQLKSTIKEVAELEISERKKGKESLAGNEEL
ncbi:TetR/AcrR family transcriptional regulator [Candidatus Nanohalococcus occultus]|uniref:Transcriptional regulator, TetR/AcrR family n=1 Tax=Candidatus Nanohalococcus occultus TaxID=2978047 RepID=A0ABY8CE55_9ARCH|nr:Transcriptional regulator, TetR/AcrR family [Candidatus Nanohaloarchaeota archaeon SVXNc]